VETKSDRTSVNKDDRLKKHLIGLHWTLDVAVLLLMTDHFLTEGAVGMERVRAHTHMRICIVDN
jgi:hypothetical protein